MVEVGFGGWIFVVRMDVIGCWGCRVVMVGIIDDVFCVFEGVDAIVDVGILLTVVVAAAIAICSIGGCH